MQSEQQQPQSKQGLRGYTSCASVSCGLVAACFCRNIHSSMGVPWILSSLKLRAVRAHDAEFDEFHGAHLLLVAHEIGKGQYLPHPRVKQ